MSKFFIERPILANVIAIITILLGAVCLYNLPVAQYPQIVPPTIQVSTSYADGVRHRFRARAGITGAHLDGGRDNLRILRNRQVIQADGAQQDGNDGDDVGEDRPLNEEFRHALFLVRDLRRSNSHARRIGSLAWPSLRARA